MYSNCFLYWNIGTFIIFKRFLFFCNPVFNVFQSCIPTVFSIGTLENVYYKKCVFSIEILWMLASCMQRIKWFLGNASFFNAWMLFKRAELWLSICFPWKYNQSNTPWMLTCRKSIGSLGRKTFSTPIQHQLALLAMDWAWPYHRRRGGPGPGPGGVMTIP